MKKTNRVAKLLWLMVSRPPKWRKSAMTLESFRSFAAEHPPVLDARMQYVFFSHNKVAQTSINRKLLRHRSIVRKDSERVWRFALDQYLRLWKCGQPVTFTIVRDPYSRTVPAFKYLKRHGKIDHDIGFDTFVVDVLGKTGPAFDPHFTPQEKYSMPICEMGLDHIIRIEDLDTGWPHMAEHVRLPRAVPHENVSRSDLKQPISDEARTVIQRLYARDFEGLGYPT